MRPRIYYRWVNAMNGAEITTAVTALAQAISQALSDDELTVFAALVTQLGDTLESIAAIREIAQK